MGAHASVNLAHGVPEPQRGNADGVKNYQRESENAATELLPKLLDSGCEFFRFHRGYAMLTREEVALMVVQHRYGARGLVVAETKDEVCVIVSGRMQVWARCHLAH